MLQNNVKRMLAYSSIAHAGYLLLGIVAANSAGKGAVLFYLLTYAVANMGALGIVALLGTADHPHDQLRDFAGLWKTRPGLAGLMTVFLLSLGGFPPTAGFIAKWYIFSAAVQEGHYTLAIIGVLSSVVSVFFYLRIVVMMYMTEEPDAAGAPGDLRPRDAGARASRCSRRSTSACCPTRCSSTRCSRFRRSSNRRNCGITGTGSRSPGVVFQTVYLISLIS